jgi:D-inositol-3-phosphate glycosyltransferase
MARKDSLRIAMLSVHSCPVGNLGARDTGGMSVYIRELARELGRRGHIVDVYTRVHDPHDPQIIELGENARLIHLMAGGIGQIDKVDIYPHLPGFAAKVEAFRRESGQEYDIIFSHYWLSGRVGECLCRQWKVPHATMFHTLGAVKNALASRENEPQLRIDTERLLVKGCQRIVAPTEREKANLSLYYGDSGQKTAVIPCGINLERFRPADRAAARRELGLRDEKMALFVGRFDPLKGIDRLLQAMPLLKYRGARLLLVGGDEDSRQERERFLRLAEELGVGDSIDFRGLVRHEQLPLYYNAADVCIIPSHYESFGLVALESLACGTPVVSTDVGNVRDIIIQDSTGAVVAGSPESLAEKIDMFLLHPNPNAGLLRSSVSRFGWGNIARQIEREFCNTLATSLAEVA